MNRKRAAWADGLAVIALCALSVAFYRHIVLSNRILAGVDALTYFYPYRDYAAQVIRSGHIPLWNPYLFLGVPFVANAQTAVFYPLNLALAWLSAPKLLAWSAVLHTALAAECAYLYARVTLRLSPLPAALGASAFALGGYLSGQIEHINQLNVLAWFPLLLLLWDLRPRTRWPALLGIGATVGIGLLAGHTQSSYITLFGLAAYALVPALAHVGIALARRATPLSAALRRAAGVLLELALAVAVALGLAAVQILPTLELSRLSIRSGGLSYREAVAFSLKPLPRLLRYTFLPPWGRDLVQVYGGAYFTEYLATMGLLPLLLGGGWAAYSLWRAIGRKSWLHEGMWQRPAPRLCLLAALGAALALGLYNPLYLVPYKLVPGFNLFRVPARWLFLYAFGAAMIAAVGAQRLLDGLETRLRGAAPLLCAWFLAVIVLLELFSASAALPFSHPTAPQAYTSMRTAPAHILAVQRQQTAPGRFLSLSDILFDPGDLAEMQAMFRDQLSDRELYDYVVSAKRKEILAPNLPLAWRAYAVDGYDGGLLPLARYIQIQRLLLKEEDILIDGRLRERLKRVPPSRLLSILGARYVLTDKVHDAWIDDVFYDLGFDAALGKGSTPSIAGGDLPPLAATGIGIVSYLQGARATPDGTPVAEVHLTTQEGETMTYLLRAGQDTAEGLYDAGVQHAQARVGRAWPDRPEGAQYVTRLDWGTPRQIARIQIDALPFGGQVHIRGLSLVDERDGSNAPILLSTDGQYRQVHSGDVKIYEVLDALPRAYVVHRARVLADDNAALAAIADPGFDPAREAVLSAGQPLDSAPSASQVTIPTYAPEQVTVQASTQAPGYLVLTDAWYPGWQATLDGQPMPIERANVHFRAVYLPAGSHTIRFTYRPASYRIGGIISLLSLAGIAIAAALAKRCPLAGARHF